MKAQTALPTPPARSGRDLVSLIPVHLAAWRPHLMLPAWACLFSAAALDPTLRPAGSGTWGPGSLWPAAAGLGLLLGAVHLFNLIADEASDRLNVKNLFWQGRITRRTLALEGALAGLAGLALLGARGPDLLGPALAGLGLGLAYSLRPPALARSWAGGLAAHVVGFGLVVPWLAVAAAGPHRSALAAWAPLGPAVHCLVPLVAAGYLVTTILDRAGDRICGKTTWSVRWGAGSAGAAAACCLGAGSAAQLWTGGAARANWWLPAALFVLTLTAWSWARARGTEPRRAWILIIHLTVAGAAAPAVTTWPALAAAAVGWWGLARLLQALARRTSG